MRADNLQVVTAVSDDVQRFNEWIDPYLRFLRATPGKLARLIEHTRRDLVSIESEQDHSVKARKVEILREQSNDQLSDLLLTVYSVRENIEGILERSGRPPEHPPESTNAAILQELREWRAWNRALRLLDAGIDPLDVINELAGDRIALRALQAELPAYLRSRGQTNRATELLAAIDAADMGQPPELRARVQAVREELERGWPGLKQAIQRTEHELNGNWGVVAEIPDWDENRTIKLATLADFYRVSHDGCGEPAGQPTASGSRNVAAE